jgi:hypothetical protein
MTLSPIVGLCGPSRASLYHAGAVRHALGAPFEIAWLPGWRPHESQQKPLKPGSAAQWARSRGPDGARQWKLSETF